MTRDCIKSCGRQDRTWLSRMRPPIRLDDIFSAHRDELIGLVITKLRTSYEHVEDLIQWTYLRIRKQNRVAKFESWNGKSNLCGWVLKEFEWAEHEFYFEALGTPTQRHVDCEFPDQKPAPDSTAVYDTNFALDEARKKISDYARIRADSGAAPANMEILLGLFDGLRSDRSSQEIAEGLGTTKSNLSRYWETMCTFVNPLGPCLPLSAVTRAPHLNDVPNWYGPGGQRWLGRPKEEALA